MATNHGSATSAVGERRLRPIYDWLDNGNNKRALQEAEKVLKKQPDFPCCRALMALALLRLGMDEEAQPVLNALLADAPTEDATLQAMAIAFRELMQPYKICTMYERATKKDPGHEELLSHLFMAYVRVSDFKKQQLTALQLYKVQPKNPYYFWAVMSVVLQASEADEKVAKSVMMPLAEKMVSKMYQDKKMDQEQEIHLYLMILEAQGKYSQAWEVLESPLGRNFNETTSHLHFFNFKKLECVKHLKMWPEVNMLAQRILISLPDQWNAYLDLIESVAQLEGSSNTPVTSEESTEEITLIESWDDLVKFLHQNQASDTRSRGPFLAEMEVHVRLIELEPTNTEFESALRVLLQKYFDTFGSRGCCFADMRPYLERLGPAEVSLLIFEIKSLSLLLTTDPQPNKLASVSRLASANQIIRYLGLPESLDEDVLLRRFQECQPFVRDVAATEIRAPDILIVMCAHSLWDKWQEKKDNRFFMKAVSLLEYALQLSPHNFHIRFVLIKFYNEAGAVGCSYEVYNGLELKHIQLDSLGYVILRTLQTCAHFEPTFTLVGSSLRFFTGNHKDTVDHIISAYRCGSFDKIREFVKLRHRLANSQHYMSLKVERIFLDLLTETSTHTQMVQTMSYMEVRPDKDDIHWDKLEDNRDFKVLVSWQGPKTRSTTGFGPKERSADFKDHKGFLQLRSLVLRTFVAAVYLAEDIHPARELEMHLSGEPKNSTANNSHHQEPELVDSNSESKSGQMVALIRELLRQIQGVLTGLASIDGPPPVYLTGPCPPRLHQYVRLRHAEFFQSLVEAVLALNELIHSSNSASVIENAKSTAHLDDPMAAHQGLDKILQGFKALTSATTAGMTDPSRYIDRRLHFENLFNLIESGNMACLLLGVCHSLLLPVVRPGGSKRGKKKRVQQPKSAQLEKCAEKFHEVRTHLISEFGSLSKFIQNYQTGLQSGNLEDHLDGLALAPSNDANGIPSSLANNSMSSKDRNGDQSNHRDSSLPEQLNLSQMAQSIAPRMEASYEFSCSKFKSLVEKKLAYLEALKM